MTSRPGTGISKSFFSVHAKKIALFSVYRAKSVTKACVPAGRKRRHIFVDPISGREEPIPISPAKSHRWAHRVFKDLWRNRLSRSRMIWLLPIDEGRAASRSSFYFPASIFSADITKKSTVAILES